MEKLGVLWSWTIAWTLLFFFSTVIVLLRLGIRYHRRTWSGSDILVTICLVLSIITYAVAIYGGILFLRMKGPSSIRIDSATTSMIMFDGGATILVTLSKCCVTLLLLEVEVAKAWRRALWAITMSISIIGLVNLVITLFGCYPLTPTLFFSLLKGLIPVAQDQVRQKHCVVRRQFLVVNGAINVLHEVAIFVCAMSLVIRLKSTRLQKAGLIFTFALGFLTIFASIMNTCKSTQTYDFQSKFLNFGITISLYHQQKIWMATEAYTGLIVSSLLPMRAALATICTRLIAQSNSTRKSLIRRSRQSSIFTIFEATEKTPSQVEQGVVTLTCAPETKFPKVSTLFKVNEESRVHELERQVSPTS